MTYVIAEPCIDVMDQSCVSVCPVDCIHFDQGTDRMLFIDPDECIDCGACEPECPVNAIYPEDSRAGGVGGFHGHQRDLVQGQGRGAGRRSTSGSPPDPARRRIRHPGASAGLAARRLVAGEHRVQDPPQARSHPVQQQRRAEDARRRDGGERPRRWSGSAGRQTTIGHGMVGAMVRTMSIVAGAVNGKSASAHTSGDSMSVRNTLLKMSGMTATKPKKPEYCCASRLPGAMAPMAVKMAPYAR